MSEPISEGSVATFSLLGGPLHRLGCRVGLVRGGTNTVALGLALGALLWTGLVALAFALGVGHRLFSLSLLGGHIRLLVVIPLFFLCETWLDPLVTAFVGMIVRSGVVPTRALPALQSEVARAARRKDSWLAEAVCLLAAVLLSLMASRMPLFGASAVSDPSGAASGSASAVLWYWMACLTFFRFLMFRWLWRLCLWSYFLWRVAKLDLNLVPTHPDGAAGLGYLEIVHTQFAPLVLAISAIQASSLAEELSSGTMAFEGIYPALAVLLIVVAALFLGPLAIFSPKLWACREKGLKNYMELASSYVNGFDRKWLDAGAPPGEPLLGTPDLQSLADLTNSLNVVRNMRSAPASLRLLANLAIAVALPVLPLFLFKYPLAELAEKLFTRLAGL